MKVMKQRYTTVSCILLSLVFFYYTDTALASSINIPTPSGMSFNDWLKYQETLKGASEKLTKELADWKKPQQRSWSDSFKNMALGTVLLLGSAKLYESLVLSNVQRQNEAIEAERSKLQHERTVKKVLITPAEAAVANLIAKEIMDKNPAISRQDLVQQVATKLAEIRIKEQEQELPQRLDYGNFDKAFAMFNRGINEGLGWIGTTAWALWNAAATQPAATVAR